MGTDNPIQLVQRHVLEAYISYLRDMGLNDQEIQERIKGYRVMEIKPA
jgi:hypothetical protein